MFLTVSLQGKILIVREETIQRDVHYYICYRHIHNLYTQNLFPTVKQRGAASIHDYQLPGPTGLRPHSTRTGGLRAAHRQRFRAPGTKFCLLLFLYVT